MIEYKLFQLLSDSEKKLNEGLILTHDIHNSGGILHNFLSKHFFNKIEILDNKFHITLKEGNFDKNTYIEFLILINNLGYIISKIRVTKSNNMSNTINPDLLKDNLKLLSNIISYDIILEPKYDTSHTLKSNVLYHVTESKYLDKIIKNGLVPRSNNTRGYHPDRIYLVYNIEYANEYIDSKKIYYLSNINKYIQPEKSKFEKVEFVILKVNIPENSDIKFYEDPNFKDKGIYTYENIDQKYVEVI